MSAKKAFKEMSRLQRAASTARTDMAGAEVIRSAFTNLLKLNSKAIPSFLADVLHGRFGTDAATVAWRTVIGRGVVIANNDSATVKVPLATYCLVRGNLDVVREIVMRGPSTAMPPEMSASSQADMLFLLCNIREWLDNPGRYESSLSMGLARTAASNMDLEHAAEGIKLAWDVDPSHPDFDHLAQETSAGGAVVRALRMNATIESAATSGPAAPAPRAHSRRVI
ncbi:hypothetical protein ABIC83_002931 [Roseateles asaccharophilus]|uniref:hypothetical protein n=1 Tax=Roseateles asaccharophilus TaxID=582607 RepID=UPI003836D643